MLFNLEERVKASQVLEGPKQEVVSKDKRPIFLNKLKNALYASKIISYAQGFMLMREAARENKWTLNYGGIALMWRGGCIIRRFVFISKIYDEFNSYIDLVGCICL